MSDIGVERYVRLTTFTRDGRPKHAPVWIAQLGDGTYGFTTGLSSWKVKRIRYSPSVEVTPSDARGTVADDATTISAIAELYTGDALDRIKRAIKTKYCWQYTAISALGRLRDLRGNGDENCGIRLTLKD